MKQHDKLIEDLAEIYEIIMEAKENYMLWKNEDFKLLYKIVANAILEYLDIYGHEYGITDKNISNKTFKKWIKDLPKDFDYDINDLAFAAWEYQQVKIEKLEQELSEYKKRIQFIQNFCNSEVK